MSIYKLHCNRGGRILEVNMEDMIETECAECGEVLSTDDRGLNG